MHKIYRNQNTHPSSIIKSLHISCNTLISHPLLPLCTPRLHPRRRPRPLLPHHADALLDPLLQPARDPSYRPQCQVVQRYPDLSVVHLADGVRQLQTRSTQRIGAHDAAVHEPLRDVVLALEAVCVAEAQLDVREEELDEGERLEDDYGDDTVEDGGVGGRRDIGIREGEVVGAGRLDDEVGREGGL